MDRVFFGVRSFSRNIPRIFFSLCSLDIVPMSYTIVIEVDVNDFHETYIDKVHTLLVKCFVHHCVILMFNPGRVLCCSLDAVAQRKDQPFQSGVCSVM